MDIISAFGLFAVTAMLVCYALEARSPWFILAFAGACGLASGSRPAADAPMAASAGGEGERRKKKKKKKKKQGGAAGE